MTRTQLTIAVVLAAWIILITFALWSAGQQVISESIPGWQQLQPIPVLSTHKKALARYPQ